MTLVEAVGEQEEAAQLFLLLLIIILLLLALRQVAYCMKIENDDDEIRLNEWHWLDSINYCNR